MTDIAVQGILIGHRSTADGGMKLTIELDELQAALFGETFGVAINYTVAVARLTDASESASA